MPSIYTHADSNTRKTWFLLTGFLVFIIIVGWIFSYVLDNSAIFYLAIFISIFSSFGSYWWSDKIVLGMYRAVPVEHNQNPELYHIVENLCITAGLPVPKIYIIPEAQPNAFATGRDKNHAVIAVTKGLLDKLDKPELQGVLAHELSHVGNKDMLLSTIVATLAGVVAITANLFLRFKFWAGGRRSKGGVGLILLAVGLLAAILAPMAATLIRLAISRKREFLADADGALLTRYPEGLARALEKISSDQTPIRVANDATSALFIESPYKGRQKTNWLVRIFLTHPPIEERVRALRDASA